MRQQHFESFESESEFNIKEVLMPYFRAWPYILLSTFFTLALAYIYLKPKSLIFQSEALVLVRDDNGGGDFTTIDLFEDLGINIPKSNIHNEIQAFQSHRLLRNVVRELGLQERIAKKNAWHQKTIPYYKIVPVYTDLTPDLLEALPHAIRYELVLSSVDDFNLTEHFIKNGAQIVRNLGEFKFEENIEGLLYDFKIFKSDYPHFKYEPGIEYHINHMPIDVMTKQIKARISVTPFSKETSIISLRCSGSLVEENNEILSSLIRQHELLMVASKTEMAKNTSAFINGRMQIIEEELSGVEELGEEFKSKYGFFDLSFEAGTLLSKSDLLERQIIEYNVQLEMVSYFAKHLNEKRLSHSLLPVNIGFQDDNINSLTQKYNDLFLQFNELSLGSSAKNPRAIELSNQLDAILENLRLSIDKYGSSIEKGIELLEKKSKRYQNELAMMPSHERNYREIERQQQIKEALYIYLLQKREENEIAISSTVGSVSIMNEPISSGVPIAPNRKIVFLTSFLIGFTFPIVFIYLKRLFDTKVRSVSDLENLKIPCLGEIPLHKSDVKYYTLNVLDRNTCTEAFRRLRTNINFMLQETDKNCKTIMISSSFSNEGKTFISVNLAKAISFTNKKVLILGADLRKPNVLKYFEENENYGITDFLINDTLEVLDVLHKVEHEGSTVYVIPSGPVPPNPAEMIESKRFKSLIHELKEQFDFIVIDTAPIGVVSDLLPLMEHADLLIYTVRFGVLEKNHLKLISKLYGEKKVNSFATILNASERNGFGYGYGYGYGYDYGYGYGYGLDYVDDNRNGRLKNKFLRKIKSIFLR